MNKELAFPVVPQRIAVISSKNAAGYSDFINQLNDNSFGYVFHTFLIDSIMQGTETEQSIISALDKIANNTHLFDLVAIIRGGGSQSDLSWFDSYNIAYHITQFPLPVITGIGHDKDSSVTDLVANTSLKTPTAVADFLINSMASAENLLMEMSAEIKDNSRIIIEMNRTRIETSGIKLPPLTRILISVNRDILSGKILEITNIGKEFIFRAGRIPSTQESRLFSSVKSFSAEKEARVVRARQNLIAVTTNAFRSYGQRIGVLDNNLSILKPENVLRRGYTITSLNGRIVKKSDLLKTDDQIETQFSDGVVKSRVLGKPKNI
jgi:exodeoxyribonuclease VII large subunit